MAYQFIKTEIARRNVGYVLVGVHLSKLWLCLIEIGYTIVKVKITLRVRFNLVTEYVVLTKFVIWHRLVPSPS